MIKAREATQSAKRNEMDGILIEIKKRVQQLMVEGDGFWNTCSGCRESEDGHDIGFYPHSDVFQCKLGSGCRECGGIGSVWDDTDYEKMARDMQADNITIQGLKAANQCIEDLVDVKSRDFYREFRVSY